MSRPAALLTISARTHAVAALSCVLPLVNAAGNWSNARPILDCIVEITGVTLAQIFALQKIDAGIVIPGSPPRPGAPLRQSSSSLLVSSSLGSSGADPVLMPALAGLLQVCLRAIRRVIAASGALALPPHVATTGATTVVNYLTSQTPLLEALQVSLAQLSPRSNALRSSVLGLLDTIAAVGEATSLAQHAGVMSCLQQALASDELQSRASSVIARLCSHQLAPQYIGSLVAGGLVATLVSTLASVRHPDDVMVETYATLQHVYDFSFIRDITQALGEHGVDFFVAIGHNFLPVDKNVVRDTSVRSLKPQAIYCLSCANVMPMNFLL